MTQPRSFLLTLWDGGGAVPPPLAIARALLARGHRVRVIADAALADEVTATGAEHRPWVTGPQRTDPSPLASVVREWEARTPLGAFARARDGLFVGPAGAYAADVLAELRREPADVLLTEAVFFGPQIAGEAAGIPVVSLAANVMALPGWGVPPVGPGFAPARGPLGRMRDAAVGRALTALFDRALPGFNAARAELGLDPLDHVLDQVARVDRLLILTTRAFEYPSFAGPDIVRFVGPRNDDPAWSEPWTPPAGDAPLVLASSSSTYMKQLPMLQRIATALGELPVRGVITTGPAIDPADIAAPANVTVVRSAPHTEVLRHAAAVVTHAGHGTVAKALAAGVPVVAMPLGRDQPDNAARLVATGAGLRLRPSAKPAAIAAAVRRVLAEPSFRAGAQRLADAIAADLAEDRAVQEIEALAAERAGRVAVPA